jgi:hypothetical protein
MGCWLRYGHGGTAACNNQHYRVGLTTKHVSRRANRLGRERGGERMATHSEQHDQTTQKYLQSQQYRPHCEREHERDALSESVYDARLVKSKDIHHESSKEVL